MFHSRGAVVADAAHAGGESFAGFATATAARQKTFLVNRLGLPLSKSRFPRVVENIESE
jgi:hypothetical protein